MPVNPSPSFFQVTFGCNHVVEKKTWWVHWETIGCKKCIGM